MPERPSNEADREEERALRPAADWRRLRREMRRRVLENSTRQRRVKVLKTVYPEQGIGGIWSTTMDGSNEATDSNYGELSVKYEVFFYLGKHVILLFEVTLGG